MNELRKKYEKA
jgi:hypothetical protein